MKSAAVLMFAALLAGAAIQPAAAQAAKPAATASTKFSIESTVGELLANPAAKAVLEKYIPEVLANPNLQMGLGAQLSVIPQFEPTMTPDVMAKIDADLKKL